MTGSRTLSVVGFAGSLRAASYNRALLRAAVEVAPPTLRLRIETLDDVPLFNEDVEARGMPPAVARLRDAIGGADGVLIATPEYSHGATGVLKNALDWLSRPPRPPVLEGRPVALMGATPGMTGTARSQEQTRSTLAALGALTLTGTELLLGQARDKFDAEGRLTDAATRERLARFLGAFAAWIEKMPGPPRETR